MEQVVRQLEFDKSGCSIPDAVYSESRTFISLLAIVLSFDHYMHGIPSMRVFSASSRRSMPVPRMADAGNKSSS